jgi:hypothetical protein
MLPDDTVPASLADPLAVFRSCFTAPTFRTFTGLVVGGSGGHAWPHLGGLPRPHRLE